MITYASCSGITIWPSGKTLIGGQAHPSRDTDVAESSLLGLISLKLDIKRTNLYLAIYLLNEAL